MALLVALIMAACGGGSTTPATPTAPTSTPAASTSNEAGKPPVFWRTEDNFESLRAGRAYKVVFRVTNGYADASLRVLATCQSCSLPTERAPIAFQAERVTVGEGEAPGSYYPLTITLPFPGRWQIAVVADSDQITIPVDAQAGTPAPG
jgi:hypothetical protein